eukprot:PITA_26493
MNQGIQPFEPLDFLILEEELDHSCTTENAGDQANSFNTLNPGSTPHEYGRSSSINPPCIQGIRSDHNSTVIQTYEPVQIMSPETNNRKRKAEQAVKYAFRTRSETDILDDGYKWRKNYFRCAHSMCDIKKTVERDAHDNGIVITTYLGKHNHGSPYVVYYNGNSETVHAELSVRQ